MNTNQFKGVGVALVTPFTSDGSAVDFEALARVLDHTAAVDYYVVLGTTGEPATMSADECRQVVRFVVERNAGRKPIVVGIGGNCTAEVVRKVKEFDLAGVDAVLSVVPYYNKPNQEGIYRHYKAVAEASPLPVLLYNVPGRTGVNMTAATTLRLARELGPKLIGVKEASGNLGQAAMILRDRPKGFLFISGDDNLTLPLVALGADGVISVSANAFARTFVPMVHEALAGNCASAAGLNLRLHEATDLLFEEGSPVGVKGALALQGICSSAVRLPLAEASEGLRARLAEQIKRYAL